MREIVNLLVVLTIVSIVGCSKEPDLSEQKEAIIGTWVQVGPSCINCDTLTFYDNNALKSSEEDLNYSYELIDKSVIRIDRNSFVDNYMYQFSNAYSTLLIEDFLIDLTGMGDDAILLSKID